MCCDLFSWSAVVRVKMVNSYNVSTSNGLDAVGQLGHVGSGSDSRKMKTAVSTYPLDVVLQCLCDSKGMLSVFSCDHGQILNVISVIHLEILEGFAKVLGKVFRFLIRRHVGD